MLRSVCSCILQLATENFISSKVVYIFYYQYIYIYYQSAAVAAILYFGKKKKQLNLHFDQFIHQFIGIIWK